VLHQELQASLVRLQRRSHPVRVFLARLQSPAVNRRAGVASSRSEVQRVQIQQQLRAVVEAFLALRPVANRQAEVYSATLQLVEAFSDLRPVASHRAEVSSAQLLLVAVYLGLLLMLLARALPAAVLLRLDRQLVQPLQLPPQQVRLALAKPLEQHQVEQEYSALHLPQVEQEYSALHLRDSVLRRRALEMLEAEGLH